MWIDAHSLAVPMHPQVARHTHWTASFVNRTPLLRFFPLQRSLAALRCPWLPCLRTIPLRRFTTCQRPARPRTFAGIASPLRFYAPRMRCGCARVRTNCRLRCCESQSAFSGQSAPNNPHASQQVNGHPRERVRRIRIPRAREQPVTSSNTASPIRRLMPGHAPSRSLARCTATSAQSLRGLAGRWVLPSGSLEPRRPAALLGFFSVSPSSLWSAAAFKASFYSLWKTNLPWA